MNLELADVEVFLTAAEELHFGRTAERLHISPARVSQRVRALEREIGAPVFERTSRRVVLTPLGRRLREGLQDAYDRLAATIGSARAQARAPAGPLRVGFTLTTGGELLNRLVRAVETTYPDIEVTLHEIPSTDLLAPLRADEVDVLFLWHAFAGPDVTHGPVAAEYGTLAMMAADHPLADRESVCFDDLADHTVGDPVHLRPQTGGRWLFPLQTSTGRPLRTHASGTFPEVMNDVARGRYVHVIPASTRTLVTTPNIVLIPIEDLPPVKLGLIWHTARENVRIRALADTATTLFSTH